MRVTFSYLAHSQCVRQSVMLLSLREDGIERKPKGAACMDNRQERNLPEASIEAPPINSSLKVILSLCDLTLATISRTRLASATTSGPTPSPGKRTTVDCLGAAVMFAVCFGVCMYEGKRRGYC